MPRGPPGALMDLQGGERAIGATRSGFARSMSLKSGSATFMESSKYSFFEPLGQLRVPLVPRRLGHARVHLRVLVGLPRDRGREILLGLADGLAGGRIAHFLQEVEVAEGMAGLRVGDYSAPGGACQAGRY